MANIGTVKRLYIKLYDDIEEIIAIKEEKDDPTDKDDEKLAALEEFREAIETAYNELMAIYDE